MTDYRKVISEEAKVRTLRRIVDECAEQLGENDLDEAEALSLIEATRKKVLGLFPGKEEQFELIYRPRFLRIIKEKNPSNKM